MPTQMKKEIICPKCSQGNKITMQIGMVNSNTTDIKTKILDETLFDWTCPNCKYSAQIVYPLVYSDLFKNYMIILTPSAGKSASIKSVENLEKTTKRRVKSLSELKEKILIFDAELNDIAIEICKQSLLETIKTQNETEKLKLYFSKVNEDNSIEFAVFLGGKKTAIYQTAKQELYIQAASLLNSVEFNENEEDFLRVGPSLATKILENSKIN